MARSYGSNCTLSTLREAAYGQKPIGNWEKFSFVSSDLSAEQGLISSDLLGQGREPGVPFRDVIKDEGNIVVPVEARDFGRWLQFLLGDPVSKSIEASGSITFTDNPKPDQTVTINGVIIRFIAASDTATAAQDKNVNNAPKDSANAVTGSDFDKGAAQDVELEHEIKTLIGKDLTATLDSLLQNLNASTNPRLMCATYAVASQSLKIVCKILGDQGNNFTITSSRPKVAIISGPTLIGGCCTHTFVSGKTNLPSFALEIGHLSIPAYFLHTGCMLNSMTLSFQRSGAATATLSIIAQVETRYPTSHAVEPKSRSYTAFSQFSGRIMRNGAPLANVTSAEFTYANGMEAVQTIRNDGLIECVDSGLISITGTIEARFGDTMLLDDAINNKAVELEIGYSTSSFALVWTFLQVYLPRPKVSVSGPGGVQVSFNWQGAVDRKLAKSVTVVLQNDVVGYF